MEAAMITSTSRRVRLALTTAGPMLLLTTTLLAQSAPPIPGATGVTKPENNPDGATPAIGAATGKVVKAVKGALGRNGKDSDVDPLKALALGTKVAMRPSEAALRATGTTRDDKTTEGTVIDINHNTDVIVVRLSDRTTEKLQLDERPWDDPKKSAPSSEAASDKVILSYVDTSGTKAEHVFRKVS
jgi:hypothetical protein